MRGKMWLMIVAVLAAVALLVAPTTAAKKRKRELRFATILSGYEEVPAVSTSATGEFRAKRVKTATGPVITYRLTYSNIQNANAAHIHLGQFGVNGGVAAFLCGGGDKPACPPTGGTVSGTIDAPDVVGPAAQGIAAGEISELIRAMRWGVAYVNVHTSSGTESPPAATGPGDFPSGEIRGQIIELPPRFRRG